MSVIAMGVSGSQSVQSVQSVIAVFSVGSCYGSQSVQSVQSVFSLFSVGYCHGSLWESVGSVGSVSFLSVFNWLLPRSQSVQSVQFIN